MELQTPPRQKTARGAYGALCWRDLRPSSVLNTQRPKGLRHVLRKYKLQSKPLFRDGMKYVRLFTRTLSQQHNEATATKLGTEVVLNPITSLCEF